MRREEEEEEDAFVDTFGPRIADDLWTYTRPAFTEAHQQHQVVAYAPAICLFATVGC